MRKPKLLKMAGGVIVVLAGLLWMASRAGYWLVIDHPEKSDVIVVLDGDATDGRYWQGIDMLRSGYGKEVLVDAMDDQLKYGKTEAQSEKEFIHESAGVLEPQVTVCSIRAWSTAEETRFVDKCLQKFRPKRVLIVTSDYHTRRALSVFRHELPQYEWSVSASHDPTEYGRRWWTHRQWAKRFLDEWEKTLWWNAVDRWRSRP